MRVNFATITAPVKTGFRELWSHKLRSLLTMLGMIFGVAAVIAMVFHRRRRPPGNAAANPAARH